MTKVRMREVTKRHGADVVVCGVDLDIDDGELFVVLGPSGCGKSSMLRMIAGLDAPTSGSISIDGVAVGDPHGEPRSVAMMFQEPALYPHLDVWANIAFPLKMAGERPAYIRREVTAIARTLGIHPLLSRRPTQLSGGQRQRVAMARSLVRHPDVVLMDEPMSNLDTKLRGELRAAIGHLHQAHDITMIYVTHDQVEAMSLADRMAVMRNGQVIQVGTPDDVYRRPVDAFVATFVGTPSMNLLHGRLSIDSDGPVVEVASTSIRLDRARWPGPAPIDGLDVIVGVRPHSFRFADHGMVVDVDRIEPVGDRRFVSTTLLAPAVSVTDTGVTIGSGPNRLTIDVPASDRIDTVRWRASHLAVDADEIHLFDAVSGRSIVPSTSPMTSTDQTTCATT